MEPNAATQRIAEKGWTRDGPFAIPPDGKEVSMEETMEMMWLLAAEAYGLDPDNPPPMRRDVVRIVSRGREEENR